MTVHGWPKNRIVAVAVAVLGVLVPSAFLAASLLQPPRREATRVLKPAPSVNCTRADLPADCPAPTPTPTPTPSIKLPSPIPSIIPVPTLSPVPRPVPRPSARPQVGLWSQVGGDAAHDNFNASDTGITLASLQRMRSGWYGDQASTQGIVSTAVTISGAWAYVSGFDSMGAFWDDPACHKLGPGETGSTGACRPVWVGVVPGKHDHPDTFVQPAVAGGVVYVAASSNADGVWAFKADGCGKPRCDPLWHYPADSNFMNLTVDGDNVIASGAGMTTVVSNTSQTTANHGIWVFPARCAAPTCGPKWTAAAGTLGAPAVGGGFIFSFDSNISKYAEAGCGATVCAPLWSVGGPPTKRDYNIAYSGGSLYVTGDASLWAMGAATGSQLWTAFLPSPSEFSGASLPAIGYGNVYVVGGDGTLRVFGAPSGQPLWSAPGSGAPHPPVLADHMVFAASGTTYPAQPSDTRPGIVSAYPAGGCGAATCAAMWSSPSLFFTNSPIPVVANGRLYVMYDQVPYEYYTP